MFDLEETPEQRDVADYSAYLQLKDINYSNKDIANHLSYTITQLEDLIRKFKVDSTYS